ncbi:PLP-dependent aminotransferase family protein [Ileibacterium valens]|uniref:MocR-like pyridoxine biosynthesis transcription factor PdxR n=1 Tax=Ileibacterium valens TaxID=1862668 RepID=UPI00272C7056|nr:PLP-dependent aminotransferase family protein [Ileibacterium valens]
MKSYILTKPLSRSLYEQIREDIITKEIAPHTRLPSKRELASHLKVSLITVEHALDQLEAEGYIEARTRSGTYVLPQPSYKKQSEPFEIKWLEEEPATPVSDFPGSLWYRTLRHVITTESDRLLQKSPSKGCARLRNAIAAYLFESRGMKVQPSQVIVSSGAESLYQIVLRMFDSIESIAIEDPCYQQIPRIYAAHHIHVHPLPILEDGIESEALNGCQANILHVTPFLSVPSGFTASASKRHEYLEWAYRNKAYILEDDYNSEFFQSGPPLPTLYSLDHNHQVIYMNTFSKSLSPSLRAGYMVLPEHLLDLYEEKAGMFSNTVPLLEQYTLAEFISNGSFERLLSRKRRNQSRPLK